MLMFKHLSDIFASEDRCLINVDPRVFCNTKARSIGSFSLLCKPLQRRHDERDDVSNHQRLDCLLNRLFRPRSKKTSKLRGTGLCEGNSPKCFHWMTSSCKAVLYRAVWNKITFCRIWWCANKTRQVHTYILRIIHCNTCSRFVMV